jgi:hypothetical protein
MTDLMPLLGPQGAMASRRRPAAPASPGFALAIPPAPGTPSPLDVLIAALDALTKLDKSYSAAVTSAFSAIGAMFTPDKAGLRTWVRLVRSKTAS